MKMGNCYNMTIAFAEFMGNSMWWYKRRRYRNGVNRSVNESAETAKKMTVIMSK